MNATAVTIFSRTFKRSTKIEAIDQVDSCAGPN